MNKNILLTARQKILEKTRNMVTGNQFNSSLTIRKIQDIHKKDEVIRKDESPSVQLFKKVKILKNPCCPKCTFKCTQKITPNQRQQILKYFYSLHSLPLRKLFIQRCIEGSPNDYRYNFTINGNRMQVCKPFYLTTISVTPSYVNAALVQPSIDIFKPLGNTEKIESKETQQVELEKDSEEVEKMEEDASPEHTPIEPDNDEEDMGHSLEYICREEEENDEIKGRMVEHITSIPRIVTCLQTKEGRQYVETYIKATKMYDHYVKCCKENDCQVGGFPLYNKLFLENHEIMVKARKNLPVIEPDDAFILGYEIETSIEIE